MSRPMSDRWYTDAAYRASIRAMSVPERLPPEADEALKATIRSILEAQNPGMRFRVWTVGDDASREVA